MMGIGALGTEEGEGKGEGGLSAARDEGEGDFADLIDPCHSFCSLLCILLDIATKHRVVSPITHAISNLTIGSAS
jgi:hypothetical protein